ncbi:MAG TPA: hypothetical protein ENJ42_05470 [Hellea balneolensis]|uniref:Uncharacterized protein n=1 Tax=Hellea balneolensis TaxID=287478 RepID=A0A7C5R7J9_9PROT|nr:hypothetical protein [Hellea balneolensis]
MITSDDIITLKDIKEYNDLWYSSAQEVDPAVLEGHWRDVLTPFAKGKDWLYELTLQHQQRTGQLLMNGGELGLGCKLHDGTLSLSYICYLFQEVQGQVIEIPRMFKGGNPSDPDYQDRIDRVNAKLTKERGYTVKLNERHLSLPEPIRLAYYHRFNGLNIPNHPAIGICPQILPYPTNSWDPIENLLGDLRLKKKYLPLIDEMFPDTMPEAKDLGYEFRAFLNSWGSFIGKKRTDGDQLFVKTKGRDGVVYYLRDADVPNLMVLTDPAEAIDQYCEFHLLRKEGRFDFRPWAAPYTG